MYRHASTCLKGPVRRSHYWWNDAATEETMLVTGIVCLEAPTGPQEEGELRLDLVARVRAEIAAGTYDTPDKMEVAFERLLDRLNLS